nr:uncharacterized protein LOC131778583 [Pocillopora verrucosa]
MYSVFNCVPQLLFCVMISTVFGSQETNTADHRVTDGRQGLFSVDEFRYLNVPRVGIFSVHDDLECIMRCVQHPSCISVNLALEIRLRCELLSFDKYSNSREFKQNESSHHYHIVNMCAENHCANNASCQRSSTDKLYQCLCPAGYEGARCQNDIDECAKGNHHCSPYAFCKNTKGSYNCACKPGFTGNGRECKGPTSCKEIYDKDTSSISGVVTLFVDSNPLSVFCHMGNFGCGDGGWTPVMKIDGRKTTFHYDAHYWINYDEFNLLGGETGFDEQESKLSTYWNTSFSKICLGMKINQQLRFIVISKLADSLHSLIADGQYRNTSLGRDGWKKLIGSNASLQRNCNKEGFNAVGDRDHAKVRIGIVSNDQNHCESCNSLIGFGTGSHPKGAKSCGNEALQDGGRSIKAMGYILVQ